MPENAAWVNPLTASTHRLNSGDYVKLRNSDGTVSNPVRVRVTERIGPNAVYVVHGFGHTARGLRLARGIGANDAELMNNVKVDPIMGGTGMRANFVTFETV
jgi:thiosulfate reductase/polysulfide reductase chain A